MTDLPMQTGVVITVSRKMACETVPTFIRGKYIKIIKIS
jgi:hypothetical protein